MSSYFIESEKGNGMTAGVNASSLNEAIAAMRERSFLFNPDDTVTVTEYDDDDDECENGKAIFQGFVKDLLEHPPAVTTTH